MTFDGLVGVIAAGGEMSESVWKIANDGSRFGYAAVKALPRLTYSAFFVFILSGILISEASTQFSGPASQVVEKILASIVYNAIFASLTIGIYRFAILKEVTDRLVWQVPDNFGRIWCWYLAINIISGVPFFLLSLSSLIKSTSWELLGLCSVFSMLALSTRLTLLFPALAIDDRSWTWRDTWARSNGQVGRFVSVIILAVAPMFILVVLVDFCAGFLFLSEDSITGVIELLSHGVTEMLSAALTAGAGARLFQIYEAAR
jgi:hypothetical protein